MGQEELIYYSYYHRCASTIDQQTTNCIVVDATALHNDIMYVGLLDYYVQIPRYDYSALRIRSLNSKLAG